MAYKIRVENRQGVVFSRPTRTKKSARELLKLNMLADRRINKGIYFNKKGKRIKITNKYRVVKA